jgi:hypothetical protein
VESPHAYIRRVGGVLYVCPWEIRLRSWLAFDRLNGERRPGIGPPPAVAERVAAEFERWKRTGRPLQPHIQSSTWHVPLHWFALFDPAERYLLLGGGNGGRHGPDEPAGAQVNESHAGIEGGIPGPGEADHGGDQGADHAADHARGGGPPAAATTRTLIYVTAMGDARRRMDYALRVLSHGTNEGIDRSHLEAVGAWLAKFSPHGLVELDYGGLVQLVDDEALRADESVAEAAVALAALQRGELELTVAMYKRLRARWRAVRALESAN